MNHVSRKKKRKSAPAVRVKPASQKVDTQDEERSSVAITVAWMLSTLACLMAESVWIVSALWIQAAVEDPQRHPLIIVPDMMRLVAVCTGILALILLPFVLRVRQTPPPRAIIIFSIIVGALPLTATLVRLAFGT